MTEAAKPGKKERPGSEISNLPFDPAKYADDYMLALALGLITPPGEVSVTDATAGQTPTPTVKNKK